MSRRRLGRASCGKTSGCRANRTNSLRRRGRLLASSHLGCPQMPTAACARLGRAASRFMPCTGLRVAERAGVSLLRSGPEPAPPQTRRHYRQALRPHQNLRHPLHRALLRCRSKTSSTTSLNLMTRRLQQTEAAHSPHATGKNQGREQPNPTPQHQREQERHSEGPNQPMQQQPAGQYHSGLRCQSKTGRRALPPPLQGFHRYRAQWEKIRESAK